MNCIPCKRIELIKKDENPYFVYKLETGYVVIGDYQHFKGYTVFIYKDHVIELHLIPYDIRVKHLYEVSVVYEAVYNVFKPEKMNLELLGNGENSAHMHWHFFPRNSGDTKERGPVWLLTKEEMYNSAKKPSKDDMNNMKMSLKKEIIRIFNKVKDFEK